MATCFIEASKTPHRARIRGATLGLRGLRGFAIGVSAGVTRYSNVVSDVRQSLSAPTAGILLDYNWLLGLSERFLVGTGIGAKRVLAAESERQRARVDYATVTTRLILGFAF